MELSRRMNIRHPWKGGFPFVLTTDFLISKKDGLHARTVKCSDELENPRIIEKFSIERAYWSSRGVDWKIVTEKQIDRNKALNLQWLYSGESPESIIPDTGLRQKVRDALLELVGSDGLLKSGGIVSFEDSFHLPPGSAITLYKSLVLDGSVSPDLNQRLFP
jgi:hypothetical protein